MNYSNKFLSIAHLLLSLALIVSFFYNYTQALESSHELIEALYCTNSVLSLLGLIHLFKKTAICEWGQ